MKRHILLLVFAMFFVNLFSQDDAKKNDVKMKFNPALFPNGFKNINIYANKECGRCTGAIESFIKEKISYNELDLGDQKIFNDIYNRVRLSLPFPNLGFTLNFPIIEIDSTLFYNLEDPNQFAKDLNEYIQKTKGDSPPVK